MPTTVDNRVVELKFDNRDFEKNTKQSMATLDKLKASLDMTDAERNFNKISRASDEVSFRQASDSVDTFSVKLSAMSSVAVAAVGRITNSLMDMGEQMLRNITGVDYISSGFSKYEDIIGYQQTMLNNAKDLSTDEMQKLLDKLVWFADETSFSADAMMQAMSSYISAGATEIEAQAAALGTALWAARTGNSNESLLRANYNLPQIFGKGYMQMQDWASIVNAKMDAPWVRDLFIETAAELGTLTKEADGFYTTIGKKKEKVDASTFTGTFKGEWLTTQVLLKTFEKLTKFTDDVYDEVEETGELTFDVIKRLGDGVDDIGYKALKMAQETKTWSEAWGYIQGALSAGWSRTFEYIFGSYETAKEFFSSIVENLYTIFLEPGNSRNNLFKEWSEYTPIVAKNVSDTADAVDDVVSKLENARDIVLNIIRGNYGNGAVRVQALAEKYGADAGRELQNIVNQVWKQWDGKKWSLNYELLDQLTATKQVSSQTAAALKEAVEDIEEATEPLNGRDDFLDGLAALAEGIGNIFSEIYKWTDKGGAKIFNLTGEGLYEFTHKLAEAFRAFRDNSEDFEGSFIFSWLYSLKKILLIIDNLTQPIRELFKSVGKGFIAAFFPEGTDSAKKMGLAVSYFLKNIEKLTSKLRLTEEQSEKLAKIFQGLFTPFKIIRKILSSISDAVVKIFNKTDKGLGGNTLVDKLLDIGEGIANIIIGFDEWLDKSEAIDKFVVPAVQFVSDALGTLWGWLKKILHLDTESKFPTFEDLFQGWQNAKSWIHEHIISPIEETFGIDLHFPTWDEVMEKWGKLKNWLKEHVKKPIEEAFGIELRIPTWDDIVKGWKNVKGWVKKNIISPFEEITGIDIHWPTWEEIKSKWNGFKDWVKNNIITPIEQIFNIDVHWPTGEEIKNFFSKIWEFFTSIFGKKDLTDKSVETVKKQGVAWETIGSIFKGIIEVIKNLFGYVGELFKFLGQDKNLNAAFRTGLFAFILEMISRLYESMYGFLEINPVFIVNELLDSLSSLLYSIGEKNQSEAVKNLATSVAILVGSMLALSLIPTDKVREAIAVILELIIALGAIAALLNKLSKTGGSKMSFDFKNGFSRSTSYSDLYSVGTAFLELAGAVVILAIALRVISKIGDPNQLKTSLYAVEELLLAVAGVVIVIQKTAPKLGEKESLGSSTITILAVAIMINSLVKAIIKFSNIPNFNTDNGAYKAVEGLIILIAGLVAAIQMTAQKLGKGEKAVKATGTIIAAVLSISLLISVVAAISEKLTSDQIESFKTVMIMVSVFGVVLANLLIAIGIMSKLKPPKQSDPFKFIKMAIGISMILQSLAFLLAAATAGIALIAYAMKDLKAYQIDGITELLGKVMISLLVIAGAFVLIASGIGAGFSDTGRVTTVMMAMAAIFASLGVAFLAISAGIRLISESSGGYKAIQASMAAAVAIITSIAGAVFLVVMAVNLFDSSGNSSSKIFKNLLGLSVLMIAVGVAMSAIMASTRLLSDSKGGTDAIYASLAAISGIVAVVGIMLAMLAGISASGAKMSSLVGVLFAASAAVAIIALALAGLTAAVNNKKIGGPGGVDALGKVMGALAVMVTIVGSIVALLAGLTTAGANLTSVSGTLLALSGSIAIIAVSLSILTAAVGQRWGGETALWNAVGAIAALFGLLTVVAGIASIPIITAGFTAVTGLLVAMGAAAVGFGVGAAIIVAALVALKDAIYDIGKHGDEFKAGVLVVFTSIAEGFNESLPVVLETLVQSVDIITKALIEMLVQLMINVNARIPELVAEGMKSIFKILDSLKGYIGPLVATILDFVIEVLEGVAYAINTRGGKLVAAIMDVIGSILALTLNVLSGFLSAILHIFGADAAAEKVTAWFSDASSTVITAMADAGSDIIKQSDRMGKEIVANNPRLAEYYEKYANTIESSINDGAEGVEAAVSSSGSGISGVVSNLFGGEGLTSLFKTDGSGFDLSSLMSFGESSGITFSDGLQNGLTAFSASEMFPSIDEFYNMGSEAAEASQSGYAKALYTGLATGKFKTLEEVSKYISEHGIENEQVIEGVYDAIQNGEITSLAQAIAMIDANKVKMEKEAIQKDAITAWGNKYKDEASKFVKPEELESGDVHQRDSVLESYFGILADLPSLISDRSDLGEMADGLYEVRDALTAYGYEEYKIGVKVIDYLLGLTDELPGEEELQKMRDIYVATKDDITKTAEDVIKEGVDKQQSEKADELMRQLKTSGLNRSTIGSTTDSTKYNKTILDKYDALNAIQKDAYDGLMKDIEGLTDPNKIANKIKYWDAIVQQESEDAGINYVEGRFESVMNNILSEIDKAKGRVEEMTPVTKDLYAMYGEAAEQGSENVKTYYDEMIKQLAEKVPEAVEMFNEKFGDTINVPKIDWAAIIDDPASISEEEFSYLMSYMYLLGEKTSTQFIDGLTMSFKKPSETNRITSAVSEFADGIPKAAKERLEIQSPSKVAEEIGDFFVRGAANGITKNADLAGDASSDMGLSMWQSLKDALSASVGMNLDDLNPVIRPILDLTDIINGSDQINALLASGQVYRRGTGLGIGSVGCTDLNAIAQMNKTGLAQAIQESVLSQPVNQTLNNTFNIQSNDPNEVARKVSAILSNQIQRKNQVWGPLKNYNVAQ